MALLIDGIGTVADIKAKAAAKPTVTSTVSSARKTIGAAAKGVSSVPVTSPIAITAPTSTKYTGAKTQPAPVTGGGAVSAGTGSVATPGIAVAPQPILDPKIDEKVADPTGDGGFNDQLAQFTEDDIAAALAAIEAEFGLTREELLRDQTLIGAQYRLLTAQLARQREKALGQAEAGALQRGLFRSGIFAAEVGDIAQQFGEAQAEAQTQYQAQNLNFESQLEALDAEKARVQAEQETALRRGEYTARLQAAGL